VFLLKEKEIVKKLGVFAAVIGMIFIVLGMRLFYLQVVRADTFEDLADKNKFRIVSIPARRGDIYDRDMEVLATSKPVFSVTLTGSEIAEKENVAAKMAEILDDPEITQETILQALMEQHRPYEPVIIKRLPYDEGIQMVTRIEERREELPGVEIREEPMRYYPLGSLAGHILGTVVFSGNISRIFYSGKILLGKLYGNERKNHSHIKISDSKQKPSRVKPAGLFT
jgi:penicillin-binding protein 2